MRTAPKLATSLLNLAALGTCWLAATDVADNPLIRSARASINTLAVVAGLAVLVTVLAWIRPTRLSLYSSITLGSLLLVLSLLAGTI